MANYTKLTDFASKDTLPTGSSGKIVKGTELDDEFEGIETAIGTKADIDDPDFTGTPTAPTASAATNNTQIATTAYVTTAIAAINAVPAGVILMWSGAVDAIPTGFVLCDGNNSTPDLRNRFVVGAGDTYAVDATGGSADAIIVDHTHTITDPGHSHTYSPIRATGGSNEIGGSGAQPTSLSTGTSTTGITIDNTGESGTDKNLPPYYALAYIMKT